ncbi:MAG: hypothetical protein E7141_02540 [Rikenellaceae bacterium]|nr:hypothetical protein [Rikenellaceae bacterium]
MKKLFVSILALAAFVACQSNFEDVTANTPGLNDQVVPEGMVRIYAEVGVGEEETKATYGDDFSALWEENDQIAILQESANYGDVFSTVNKLNIKSGAGTSYAAFNGDITVPTESPRRYHIAYPADAVSFNTSSTLTKTSESTYAYRKDGLEVGHYYATASFDYTYNSTLNITVPTSQSGKWEPYMYASTEEAVNSNAIGAKTLTTLTGAIAVRAYKPNDDGTKTPLQLKAIAVTATKPIAGAFSGTAKSIGSLGSITGAETSDVYSTVSEDNILGWKGAKYGREEAEKLLLAKAQSMTPASVTPTSALSLAFAGSEYTVGAEDTEWVAADNDGNYTYYINVAPFENADLTIMATTIDGSTLIRTISAQSIAASQRKGYIFTWEEATLSVGSIESWYDDYAKSNFELAGNTLYVRNLEVKGVPADQVKTLGVVVNGELHTESAKSGVLTIDKIEISGLANGKYPAYGYAKVIVNGEERELIGSRVSKNVTSIPSLTNYSVLSSYSKDGTVAKNNSIDGRLLKVTANLTDDYFANNGLVSSFEVYNGNTPLGNITNGEWSNTNAALGQYSCYVKISFTNGYLITTQAHTTHVTGIPYYADWRSADYSDWKYSNISDKGSYMQVGNGKLAAVISPKFYLPEGSLNVKSAIAAYTSATSTGNYNRSYIYAGTQSSSAKESGNYVIIGNGLGSASQPNTPLVTTDFAIYLTNSAPCVVHTLKDFALFCDTNLYQIKIMYY